jgi:chaperone modulatory protein CbpM
MPFQIIVETKPIPPEMVAAWIEAGWLTPIQDGVAGLSEIDLARALLIDELRRELGVNDESVPIILELIDQLHGLRRALREALARADAAR